MKGPETGPFLHSRSISSGRDWLPEEISDCYRSCVHCFQASLDIFAIPHDDDGKLGLIDVLPGYSLHIGLGDTLDIRHVIVVVVER